MKLNRGHIDPDDVLVNPWCWTEISSATALVRSAFVPVVAVYSIQGRLQADLFGPVWTGERVCFHLDSPETRFFLQVGIPTALAAQSAVPAAMSLSPKGAEFIRGYEKPPHKSYDKKTGRYSVFDDGYKNPTIGYGHLVQKGEDFKQGLTEDQAQKLFLKDSAGKIKKVNDGLKVGVSQNQFDALVSLTFNVGGVTKPITILNAGGAVKESDFTQYDHAHKDGKKVFSQGLLKRRKAEWSIFSKGVYNSAH